MKKRLEGLTLIEILFAVGILAILLAAILGGFGQLATTESSLKYQASAVNDAKKIMEQVRLVADEQGLTGQNSVTDTSYWDNEGGTGWIETESFSSLPGATRSVTFPDGTSEDPLHVRVTISWQEKGANKSYSLDTFVTKRT